MKLNYEIKLEDYIAFNMNFIDTSKAMKRSLLVQRFLFPLIFLVLAKFLQPILEISLIPLMIIMSAIVVVWMAFYDKWYRKSIKRKISKLIESGKVPGLIGKHELLVDATQISDKTKESFTYYNTVDKVNETKTHVFVYVSQVMAYIVPKTAFESDSDKESFIEMASKLKPLK
ncbi:MAG: hypothetical protein BGO41_03550 [Clostridiales bacterium 38-18]|nr:MAG: hypothetical protein BGO41_03550 [Clostridiales bacterium 38-18]